MKFYACLVASLVFIATSFVTAQDIEKNSPKTQKQKKSVKLSKKIFAKTKTMSANANVQNKIESLPIDVEVFFKGIPFDSDSQANDAWVTSSGSFDMRNNSGRAMYYFINDKYYHTIWEFEDNTSVEGMSGWTYKERGTNLYMFFSEFPETNGKFKVLYSLDNNRFRFFDWAR